MTGVFRPVAGGRGGGVVRRSAALRVALVGTRGVPARYGGFETCVEEVGARLAARGHDVVVYCRPVAAGQTSDSAAARAEVSPLTAYRGMRLINLRAMKKRSLETLSHT